jgi:hypothetical protein
MTVEVVTTINTLDPTLPAFGDPKAEGDNHLRNIKSALKTTFPNVAGAVTVSHLTLNSINVTQPLSENSTKPATTEFVHLAIGAAAAVNLPPTAGNQGKVLTLNQSAVPVWGTVSPDFILQTFGVL